jgi:zinc protease
MLRLLKLEHDEHWITDVEAGALASRRAEPDRGYLADAAAELLSHDDEHGFSLKDFATLDWVMRLGARLSTDVGDATTFGVRGTAAFADWHLWRLHWLLESGSYSATDISRANADAARPSEHRDIERARQRALYEALLGPDHPYLREAFATHRAVSSDDLGKIDEPALRRAATGR